MYPEGDYSKDKSRTGTGPKGTAGVVDASQLYNLTYFDPTTQCVLDMMHLCSGIVGRHLIPLIRRQRLGKVAAQKKSDDAAQRKKTPAQLLADQAADKDRAEIVEEKAAASANADRHRQSERDKAGSKKKGERAVKHRAEDHAREEAREVKEKKSRKNAASAAAAAAAAAPESEFDRPQTKVSMIQYDSY